MSKEILFLIILVTIVLIGSALCSGIEAAILAVNPLRVHEIAERTKPLVQAKRLKKLRQKLGRTLAVLVIANNCFNIFGSLMLGGYAAVIFESRKVSGVCKRRS